MGNWISNSLTTAAEILDPENHADVIENLRRIDELFSSDVDEVFRHPETEALLEELDEIFTPSDLARGIVRVRGLYDLQHVAVVVVDEAGYVFPHRALTTYPEAWVTEYVSGEYHRYDPTFTLQQPNALAFLNELRGAAPVVERFVNDMQSAGIGPAALANWVQVYSGSVISVTITSSLPEYQFRSAALQMKADFQSVMHKLAVLFARVYGAIGSEADGLETEDLFLLRAVAAGRPRREVAQLIKKHRLGQRATSRLCTRFRARTIAQAASMAAVSGALSAAPLRAEDFMFAEPGTSTSRKVPAGKYEPSSSNGLVGDRVLGVQPLEAAVCCSAPNVRRGRDSSWTFDWPHEPERAPLSVSQRRTRQN